MNTENPLSQTNFENGSQKNRPTSLRLSLLCAGAATSVATVAAVGNPVSSVRFWAGSWPGDFHAHEWR